MSRATRTRSLGSCWATRTHRRSGGKSGVSAGNVRCAFLDEPPYLSDIADDIGGALLVLAPILMGGGPHETVDVRTLPTILRWPSLPRLVVELIASAPPEAHHQPTGSQRSSLCGAYGTPTPGAATRGARTSSATCCSSVNTPPWIAQRP